DAIVTVWAISSASQSASQSAIGQQQSKRILELSESLVKTILSREWQDIETSINKASVPLPQRLLSHPHRQLHPGSQSADATSGSEAWRSIGLHPADIATHLSHLLLELVRTGDFTEYHKESLLGFAIMLSPADMLSEIICDSAAAAAAALSGIGAVSA